MITSEEILKAIAKELHEMNKKLDRIGQASIFKRDVATYRYVEDESGKEDIIVNAHAPNSQEKHSV